MILLDRATSSACGKFYQRVANIATESNVDSLSPRIDVKGPVTLHKKAAAPLGTSHTPSTEDNYVLDYTRIRITLINLASLGQARHILCDECDMLVEEHYHCNMCNDGDHDLCKTCFQFCHHCPGLTTFSSSASFLPSN